MLVGPMCSYTLILDHKNEKVVDFLSPLSKISAKRGLPLHFLFIFFSLYGFSSSPSSPFSSSIKFHHWRSTRSLELQEFWRSKGLELRVQAWKGFGSTITRIQDLSSLPPQNLAWIFGCSWASRTKVRKIYVNLYFDCYSLDWFVFRIVRANVWIFGISPNLGFM